MSLPRIAGPLALLAALFMASSALAIAPVTDLERSVTRQEIARQLGPSHSYALVIGISEFDNPGWHDLSGVPTEVEKVGAALQNQGFTIVPESTVGRLDHAGLKAAIEKFFQTYGKNAEDRLVVYIATHGYSDPSIPEADGFLVASDASAPNHGTLENGYSVRELSAALTSIAAQHVFLSSIPAFRARCCPSPPAPWTISLPASPSWR